MTENIITVKDLIKKLLDHPLDWNIEIQNDKGKKKRNSHIVAVRPKSEGRSLGALFG